LILIITTDQHRYTHASVVAEKTADARTISYDELHAQATQLPRATYIFTDLDRLTPRQLHQAGVYYRRLAGLGVKVLNDPARVLSRFGLIRALSRHGINQFDAYRAEDLDQPRRWPVFLRMEGNHADPLSGLLGNQAELDAAIDSALDKGVPRTAMLIVEYAAEPVRPGLFRKLSVFRIGGQMLGFTCVHDEKWLVKYGQNGSAPMDLYDDEYRLVAENPFGEAMRQVFDIARVDYGRVDFGLVDGRPQVYEINSNPDVRLRPKASPVARRNESNELFRENYLKAMRAIDSGVRATPASSPDAVTA
jgi:hypothetical protein